jgi:hypothetical protein
MRRLHALAPVAALVVVALVNPGLARAQGCPYLRHIHMELQQQQRVYLEYQMNQAANHQATMHAARAAAAQPPRGVPMRFPVHQQTTRPAAPTAQHVGLPSRTTYHTSRPVTHESYAFHTTSRSGGGQCCAQIWWYERYLSVHMHTEPHVVGGVHNVNQITSHTSVIQTHRNTARNTPVVPPKRTAQQYQQPGNKTPHDSGDQIKVRIETLTQLTVWSYARCGRCHQKDPEKIPLLANKPQLPRLDLVPQKPQRLAERPRPNRLTDQPRPQPNRLTERPQPGALTERPGPARSLLTDGRGPVVPRLSQQPSLPAMRQNTSNTPPVAQKPAAPGVPRVAEGARPALPGRMWQPNLPSLAGAVPPPPLLSQLRLPAMDPMGQVGRGPSSSPGEMLGLMTTPADRLSQVPSAAAPGDVPSLGSLTTEAPAPAPDTTIGPPEYPPLPRTAWDPAPSLPQVAAPAATGIEPPPLPRSGRAWSAEETTTLR